MSRRSAIIANIDVLVSHGALLASNETSSSTTTMSLKSWSFSTNHDIILASHEIKELIIRLNDYFSPKEVQEGKEGLSIESEHLMINHYKMRLPAMIFGKDIVMMTAHEPLLSCTLSFNAEDALKGWLLRHTSEYKLSHPWIVAQVPMAKQWNKRQESDLRFGGKVIELADVLPWDWTFMTDYCGSLTIHGKVIHLYARSLTQVHPSIQSIGESGLNMSILQDRSQPILFYDEAILYQVP